LARVGGYLLGVTRDRKVVLELKCNMALRCFVGFYDTAHVLEATRP